MTKIQNCRSRRGVFVLCTAALYSMGFGCDGAVSAFVAPIVDVEVNNEDGALVCEQSLHPGSSTALRLTTEQIESSLQSLFSFPIDIDAPLEGVGGTLFSNDPIANPVLFPDLEDYFMSLEDLTLQLSEQIETLSDCGSAGTNLECADSTISSFGVRAFRRPLSDEEHEQFSALFSDLHEAEEFPLDFDLALAATLTAMLQTPQFLYQVYVENTLNAEGIRALSAHELAGRLSFLFLNDLPDSTLVDLAASGALLEESVLEDEARRLIAEPRGQESLERFVMEWFGVDGLDFSLDIGDELNTSIHEGFQRDLREILFASETAPLSSFLDGSSTSVNAALAGHYGIESPEDTWERVNLGAKYGGGLMTRPLFAAAHTPSENTSIILRGLAVREDILCNELGLPPDGAVDQNQEVLGEATTAREKLEARAANSTCGACHGYIDNIGIGMEDFDRFGVYRESYPDGRVVDSDGDIQGLPDVGGASFEGTAEMAQKLSESDAFRRCATRRWFEYSLGEVPEDQSGWCQMSETHEHFSDTDFDLKELLVAFVRSDAFRYQRVDTEGEGE